MTSQDGVRVEGLQKAFDGTVAVAGLSLDIGKGEFATLLGPSGCGKTTTLRCIAGLETGESGRIFLGGQLVSAPAEGVNVAARHRRIGMVFQSFAVWPHLTVEKNVAYPLAIRNTARSDVSDRVGEALSLVGLQDLGSRYPGQLSGGQQQRVALARAVVGRPDVILYDEPLSNLDARLREEMRFELRALHERLGTTSVYVTHDQQEAMALSDTIHVMDRGLIVQSGPPGEVYERPMTEFVCSFLGSANTLPVARIEEKSDSTAKVVLESGETVHVQIMGEGATHVSVRPHQLRIDPTGLLPATDDVNVLKGVVEQSFNLGDRWRYVARLSDGHQLVVEEPGSINSLVPLGSEVLFAASREHCLLL